MSRHVNRLSSLKVAAAKTKGLFADGAGLFLQVSASGSRSWIFRYKLHGRARDMGLGSLSTISLARAREIATECRRQQHAGFDPIEVRKAAQAQAKLVAAKSITFDGAAAAYIAAHQAGWRNPKHRQQWSNTLATYASPVMGNVSVQDVDTAFVMRILEPIWAGKTETAGRLRARIEAILDWAKARGLRTGENPARWRGHLSNLLPARSRVSRTAHHPALPYREVPAFFSKLRQLVGVTPRALEFLVLTAARTGEVIGARWSEVDLEQAIWTVPANRMKSGRTHRVPLSKAALGVLCEMEGVRTSDFVFPGMKRGRSLSSMSLAMLLRKMDVARITVHGFRSSFRDWAAEMTEVPREVAEAALAHVVGDKVEAAYRRSDLFGKRAVLMETWGRHCTRHRTPRILQSKLLVDVRSSDC